jgi:hypothetical protein
MATRTWVLLGLAAAVFAGLGRVREPLDLTRASGPREAAGMVAGWSPADRRRAVAALTVDLLALVPLYTALGAALSDEAGNDTWARVGLAGVVAGAAADVVEDVTALAYLRSGSARLVPAMRWGGRAKFLAPGALVLLGALAAVR